MVGNGRNGFTAVTHHLLRGSIGRPPPAVIFATKIITGGQWKVEQLVVVAKIKATFDGTVEEFGRLNAIDHFGLDGFIA